MEIFTKRKIKKCQNSIIFLILIILFINWSLNTKHTYNKLGFKKEKHQPFSKQITLKSYCACRPDVKILNHEIIGNFYKKDDYYIIFESNAKAIDQNILREYFGLSENFYINPHFTCDLDKIFTHGPHKKVLGYTYYGKNKGYITLLELIANQAKLLYPEWIIRIYYDSSIDKTVICDFECKYDNVYFCDVNRIPYRNETGKDLIKLAKNPKKSHLNDLSFIHGMMW